MDEGLVHGTVRLLTIAMWYWLQDNVNVRFEVLFAKLS
jgi:hypothetical protein